MCTGVLYKNGDVSYFGRNLDLQYQLGNVLAVCPRHFMLDYRHLKPNGDHAAMAGMALTGYGYPLFFEAVNEFGVGAASLNFPDYGVYNSEIMESKDNVASFELIPYLLEDTHCLDDVRRKLERLNLVADDFNESVKSVGLHWICADKHGSLIIERTADGLHVYDNPVNVLTNSPAFPAQMANLSNYLDLTAEFPENRMLPGIDLKKYCSGLGSAGLPGGLDSMSRFVRAAFMMNNSQAKAEDQDTLTQYFHIMQSVAQIRGVNRERDGFYEVTNYTACANLDTMDYYWTSYHNQQIRGLHVKSLNLDGRELMTYPVDDVQAVNWVK